MPHESQYKIKLFVVKSKSHLEYSQNNFLSCEIIREQTLGFALDDKIVFDLNISNRWRSTCSSHEGIHSIYEYMREKKERKKKTKIEKKLFSLYFVLTFSKIFVNF